MQSLKLIDYTKKSINCKKVINISKLKTHNF